MEARRSKRKMYKKYKSFLFYSQFFSMTKNIPAYQRCKINLTSIIREKKHSKINKVLCEKSFTRLIENVFKQKKNMSL